MSRSSPSTKIFLLMCLIGISAILSGCGFKVVKTAPEILLREPKTSYLLSADTKEVSGAQLISDCTATTIQTEMLIEWAK